MNKSELVKTFADEAGISMDEAANVTNAVFEAMKNTLLNGDRIEIRGLCSFKMKEYGSYEGRNPKTGENVFVTPKKLPFFRVGKEMKEFINS